MEEHIKKLKSSENFEKVRRTELTEENPETIKEYSRIEDAVKKSINQGHRLYPKITKIEEVHNMKLRTKFLEKSLQLYETEAKSEWKFFHGVNDSTLETILEDGFKLPDESRSYGAGIYLTSDSSQCSQSEEKGNQSRKMLYCEVYLGKPWTAKEESPDFNAESLRKLKKDSVFVQSGEALSDQYIVFDGNQVFPSYVISYDLTTFTEVVFGDDFATSKKTILPKREVDTDDVLQKHFSSVEARFLKMLNKARKQSMSATNYEITKIEFYENPTLRDRFLKKQREFEVK